MTSELSEQPIGRVAKALLLFKVGCLVLIATAYIAALTFLPEIRWFAAAFAAILYLKATFILLLIFRSRSEIRSSILFLPGEWKTLAAVSAVATTLFGISAAIGEEDLSWVGAAVNFVIAILCAVAGARARILAA